MRVPLLTGVRASLRGFLGEQASDLKAEGNLYYDVSRCGIGWHGDSERRLVVALRLGETMPLAYQWFQNGTPQGNPTVLQLHHGDMYVMSDKATGHDWKKRKIYTLRHAAGCPKYLARK